MNSFKDPGTLTAAHQTTDKLLIGQTEMSPLTSENNITENAKGISHSEKTKEQYIMLSSLF